MSHYCIIKVMGKRLQLFSNELCSINMKLFKTNSAFSSSNIYGMSSNRQHDLGSNSSSPNSNCEVCVREYDSSRPISVLRVNIVHQPTLVDHTLRFSHPERTVLKRSIRMPPLSMVNNGNMSGSKKGGERGGGRVQVMCSDPNTLCTPPPLSVQRVRKINVN